MFKFIWLIMIGLVVAAFVAHTLYCCIQASKDAASLQDWFDNMCMDHEKIVTGWISIFIMAAIFLFASSFVAFCFNFG